MQDLEILNNSYLIIGGPKNNKSEVSNKLSKQLGYKLINLDREKHAYFNDFTDYDSSRYYNLVENYGIEKAINYIHKYEMKHLNYVLDSINENVVIDFGNTYTLINDKDLLNAIKLFKNIVLLYGNSDNLDEFDKKLSRNKLLNELSTMRINIDNKETDTIVKEIMDYKKFIEVL